MLNSAAWLGKGKRSTVVVTETVPATPAAPGVEETPAQIETPAAPPGEMRSEEQPAAAKEENAISLPTESIPAKSVFPLAAEEEATARPPSARLSATAAPYMHVEIKGEEVLLTEGDRRYRVRGLRKNMSYELLKVNVLVGRTDGREDGFHVDTLDLYSARQRTVFAKQAADELRREGRSHQARSRPCAAEAGSAA